MHLTHNEVYKGSIPFGLNDSLFFYNLSNLPLPPLPFGV